MFHEDDNITNIRIVTRSAVARKVKNMAYTIGPFNSLARYDGHLLLVVVTRVRRSA